MAKTRFYRGQIIDGKKIIEIWRDASSNILLFEDKTYKIIKHHD